MSRKKYKRVEFVLHPDYDKDLIDYVAEIKPGDRSEFFRAMLEREQQGDVTQSDEQLKDQYEQLARRVDQLAHRVDTMQVMGSVAVTPAAPLIDHDDEEERQDALSAKMKKISFGQLM